MTENNGKTWKSYKRDINDEKDINESLNLIKYNICGSQPTTWTLWIWYRYFTP